MLYPVSLEELPFKIRLAKPYINNCLEHSPIPHTYEDVLVALLADQGKKLFLMMHEGMVMGAIILDVYDELGKRVMNIFMMSHDETYPHEDDDYKIIEELAGAMGVQYILYYGRRGFFKRNAPKGWKVAQVVMTKEVL